MEVVEGIAFMLGLAIMISSSKVDERTLYEIEKYRMNEIER